MIDYIVINQNLNESTADYVARVNTELLSAGPLGIQDVFLTRRLDYNTVRYALTLVVADPGPATFQAAFFERTPTQDVDAQADAFFAANPSYRAVFVRDVSQEIRRRLDRDAVMILYIDGVMPNCGSDRSRPVVVQALEDIAAGALGQVEIVSTLGLTGQVIEARNRGGSVWPSGERGYAQVQPGSCSWDGFPICCTPTAPVNISPPVIEGVGYVGYTLTLTSVGDWEGGGNTYTWVWQRNGADIPGTTDDLTYVMTLADEGEQITVAVSATNALGGPVTASSNIIEQWVPGDLGVSLLSWYDAQDPATLTLVGSSVTSWADKGPIGDIAAQGTVANQPTYQPGAWSGGLNQVLFDGADMLEDTTARDRFRNAGSGVIAAALQMITPMANANRMYEASIGGGTAVRARSQLTAGGSGQMVCAGRRLDGDGFQTPIPGAVLIGSDPTISQFAFDWANAQVFVRRNGVQSATAAFQTPGLTSNTASFRMRIGDPAVGANAPIAELLTFQDDITATTLEKVDGYLAWRNRLVPQLDPSSPYKLVPPTP